MKIIVVGCGKIGSALVSNLVKEDHDLIVIDYSADILNDITNMYDVMGVCGNATDYETLEEAGVENCELFIAVTSNDELNMLSCRIAKRMGANYTVARIRNPEYNDTTLDFLCDTFDIGKALNPELLVANEIFDVLKFPYAVKIEKFSGGKFEMIEIVLKSDSALDGVKLSELRNKYKSKVLICAVQRDDEVYIPDGNFVLKSEDKINITATDEEFLCFLTELGVAHKKARNIMILGGSKIAHYLAEMLLKAGNSVKIIEKDRERCRELCESLPNAIVINGDGVQQEILNEEGIADLDAFVALTGMDEVNILISIYANQVKVPKVISKVNLNELAVMASDLGIESIVSPKASTSDILVRYARAIKNSMGSNVETLYKILDGKAEALEFNVSNMSELQNIPLKDLKFKKNILIAGIRRGNEIIIPGGNDFVLPGDKVIVVAAGHLLNDLTDVLEGY